MAVFNFTQKGQYYVRPRLPDDLNPDFERRVKGTNGIKERRILFTVNPVIKTEYRKVIDPVAKLCEDSMVSANFSKHFVRSGMIATDVCNI